MTSLNLFNATTGASQNRYDQRWVYLTDLVALGQQRQARSQGFTPSTGTVLVYPDWTVVPTAGKTLYFTGLFPVATLGHSGEDTSYYAIINRALKKLRVPTRLGLVITTDASYPLTSYPWIDREERLIKMLEPAPVAGRPPVDASWRNPRIVLTSGTAFLQMDTPFEVASGDSLTLEVWRPAHTLISGAESTVGLAADGDTALPTVDDVREVALLEAFTILAVRESGSPDGGNWAAKAATQQQIVAGLTYLDRTLRAPDAQPVPAPAPQQAQDQVGGGVR